MRAILLAAGEGKRMRPLTLEKPKPMIDVLGKPLLHWIIESLPSEITEIILVIGYKGEQIQKYFGDAFAGRKILYVAQDRQLGNAHALELCRSLLAKGERFLFMFADDLHSPEAIKRLLKHDLGTLVREHPDPKRFGVFEVDSQNRVISMAEKPEKPKSNLVAVGVYVLDTRIFDYKVRAVVNGEYYMTDQIDQLIKEHKFVIEKTDFWHPVGYPEDIERAEQILSDKYKMSAAKRRLVPLIILAGGKGTRMPEGEKDKPKVMADIAGKPLLQHQIEIARRQGFTQIKLSLGYMADYIINWLKAGDYDYIEYVVEPKPLGTGGALRLASAGMKSPFIAVNGDDIADVNYKSLIRHSADGKYNVITGMEIGDTSEYGLLECDEYKKICSFREKQASTKKGIVNIGHYYLKPEIFTGMPDVFSIEKDLFPKLAEKGELVLMKHTGNYWFGCGTPETLKRTREYFAKSK